MHNTPHTEETKRIISLKIKGKFSDGKHWAWKADRAGYRAIHYWIERKLGKPHFCEMCGRRDLKHRQYQWVNLDHKYKRVLSQWRRMCAKCHIRYDVENNNYILPNRWLKKQNDNI